MQSLTKNYHKIWNLLFKKNFSGEQNLQLEFASHALTIWLESWELSGKASTRSRIQIHSLTRLDVLKREMQRKLLRRVVSKELDLHHHLEAACTLRVRWQEFLLIHQKTEKKEKEIKKMANTTMITPLRVLTVTQLSKEFVVHLIQLSNTSRMMDKQELLTWREPLRLLSDRLI